MSRWWIWIRINRYWKLKQWKVDEIISRGKLIIPSINIEELKEGDTYYKGHDNIGYGDNCFLKENKQDKVNIL